MNHGRECGEEENTKMASELKQRNKANKALASLPNFHPSIPVETINEALVAAGLRSMEPAIYCRTRGPRCTSSRSASVPTSP